MPFLAAELRQMTEGVWTSALGLALEAAPGAAPREGDWLGVVQIAGEWNGALVVACPQALVVRIASGMFGKLEAELSQEELRDALGETTNMVGGNLKSLLPGVCFLSLPAVSRGGNWQRTVPYSRPVTVLECSTEGVPFTVGLVEKTPRPG